MGGGKGRRGVRVERGWGVKVVTHQSGGAALGTGEIDEREPMQRGVKGCQARDGGVHQSSGASFATGEIDEREPGRREKRGGRGVVEGRRGVRVERGWGVKVVAHQSGGAALGTGEIDEGERMQRGAKGCQGRGGLGGLRA
jgi:hypothetical protein